MYQQRIEFINEIIQECLASNNNNSEPYLKERNYLWFKTYFLKSNIWFVKQNETVLFDKASEIVNK